MYSRVDREGLEGPGFQWGSEPGTRPGNRESLEYLIINNGRYDVLDALDVIFFTIHAKIFIHEIILIS